MNGKHKNIAGLTMVELAILMTISALIMSVVIQYYEDYRRTWVIEENKGRMKQIASSIEYHNSKNEFFPCPAYRNVTANEPEFGKAACPDLATLPIGTCDDGLCRVTSDIPGRTVLIGGLPFKDLNMTVNLSMNDYLDTFQNQYTYAITEDFTVVGYNGFDVGSDGVVKRQRISYDSTLKTAGLTEDYMAYALISHGENGIGAWTTSGEDRHVSKTCAAAAGTQEEENCDNDATFLTIQRRKDRTSAVDDGYEFDATTNIGRGTAAGEANMFDDFVEFEVGVVASNHWGKEAARGLQSLNTGNIAVGIPPNILDPDPADPMNPNIWTPEARLHVAVPPTGGEANMKSTQTHSTRICDDGGGNCFDPKIIAEDGIGCESQPMSGISDGEAECLAGGMLLGVSPFTCPGADEYVQGITAGGTLICEVYIP